jgi:hypothetical protein
MKKKSQRPDLVSFWLPCRGKSLWW